MQGRGRVCRGGGRVSRGGVGVSRVGVLYMGVGIQGVGSQRVWYPEGMGHLGVGYLGRVSTIAPLQVKATDAVGTHPTGMFSCYK